MKKLSDGHIEAVKNLPILNARIYENGTLLFEGKHKQLAIPNIPPLIIDQTGHFILIEPCDGLTFVYLPNDLSEEINKI